MVGTGAAMVVTEVEGADVCRSLMESEKDHLKIHRSIVTVPANNPRMVDKALASAADALRDTRAGSHGDKGTPGP